MNLGGLQQAFLLTLVTILSVHCDSDRFTAEPRSIVESPVLKEIEHKKALFYNRKPAPGTIIKVATPNGKKLIKLRRVPSNNNAYPSAIPTTPTPATIPSLNSDGAVTDPQLSASSLFSFFSTPVAEARNSSVENVTQTAASDRVFIPPYKYPFWGLPFGIYSNGGFINPGLFPFVPGGPGFPPYDGIFGGPFGPGTFPGNQNPFPPGVGTPMNTAALPIPPVANGQPPLNPTGRRSNNSGPPAGAFSPGSQTGYYYRKPPKKPSPKPKKKKKPKPKPEPDSDDDGGAGGGAGGGASGCSCNKGDPDANKKPTPSTTAAPCPCSENSAKPSYKSLDDDDHHHHYHYPTDKPETPPCPLALPPPSASPPPPTTTEYVPSTTPQYVPPPAPPPPPETPTTDYSSSTPEYSITRPKKPCKLKHRPTPAPKVYYEYDVQPDPSPPSKKPCPLKARGQKSYDYVQETPAQPPPPPAPIVQAQPQPVQMPAYQPAYQPVAQPQPQPVQMPAYQPTYQPVAQPQPYSQPIQYQQQQPQYIAAAPAPGYPPPPSQDPHPTILYKPQEIIQTPTSVTVPLPFPYTMDSNGMLQPQHNPNYEQVTYKVDLNQELLKKVTTPIVVNQPQQSPQYLPMQPTQQYAPPPTQYIVEGPPQAPPLSYPQLSPAPQPQLNYQPQYSVAPASSRSSVVLVKPDPEPNYVYRFPAPPPVSLSYTPEISRSSTTRYSPSTTPDYRIVVGDSSTGSYDKSPPMPYPYRDITSFHEGLPARRNQQMNEKTDESRQNKSYVIIDRAELEELKKKERDRPSSTERNLPPPPDVVHIEFHSEKENTPLSFHTERSREERQPKIYVDTSSDPIAEGSSQFSRIFELNNDGIVSTGRRRSSDRDGVNHAKIFRTSLVFDKYLDSDSDRLR